MKEKTIVALLFVSNNCSVLKEQKKNENKISPIVENRIWTLFHNLQQGNRFQSDHNVLRTKFSHFWIVLLVLVSLVVFVYSNKIKQITMNLALKIRFRF